MADDATPAPKRPASPSKVLPPKTPVFVDYLGARDHEGHRRPSHKIAPLVAGSEGETPPCIILRPGLNIVNASAWAGHCALKLRPKAKGDKPKPGPIRVLVDAGHVVVLEEMVDGKATPSLPTDAVELLELAARTQCPAALQVLIDHEARRKIDESGKNPRPRTAVLAALKARKATVDRRVRSPVAPGDRRRLEARKTSRVLH